MSTSDRAGLMLLLLGLLGCGERQEPCLDSSANILLSDEDNYGFEGQLEIESTALMPGSDPEFDWSSLTTDLQGHTLDPVADIDAASIIVFRDLSEEEVEVGLSTDSIDQSSLALFISVNVETSTQVHLSDFTLFGNDIDAEQYFEEGYGTWLLTLNTGTVPGVGTRMAAFVSPVADEESEQVDIIDSSTLLHVDASIASITPITVPANQSALVIDWSEITTDGQGGAFESGSIDQVSLGWYADLHAEDLEREFLDLELIADEQWVAEASGSDMDLQELANDESTFPGVDDEGAWVLALRCTTCVNPTPPFLTLLSACE